MHINLQYPWGETCETEVAIIGRYCREGDVYRYQRQEQKRMTSDEVADVIKPCEIVASMDDAPTGIPSL